MRSLEEIVAMNNPELHSSDELNDEMNRNAIKGMQRMFKHDLKNELEKSLDKIGLVSHLNRNQKTQ